MSMRDYFAAKAMAAMAASPDHFSVTDANGASYIAQTAYQLADAMLAARKGGAQ
jgi:hypothetical protein